MWSSQNEQDNRWVGLHAYIPVLEPYDPANAKELAQIAMEFSEKMKHPVLFRTVTRVSHTRGDQSMCATANPPVFGKGIDRTQKRFALVPANARKLKAELVGRWAKIEEAVEELPVKVEEGDPGLLVITSGSAFAYVMDSIKELEISPPTVINLSVPVPVQRRKVLDLATKANKIIVVEEGDPPVVETQIKAVLFDEGIKVPVLGKSNFVSPVGELSIDITNSVLAGAMGIEAPPQTRDGSRIRAAPEAPSILPRLPACRFVL